MRSHVAFAPIVAAALSAGIVPAHAELAPPVADAVVDLRTDEGAALVGGRWRYRDAHIVEIDHRAPGVDLKASGSPSRTHDLVPRAGAADFDESAWSAIAASSLEQRRSGGHLSAGWYVFRFTVPERLGQLPVERAAIYFETVVDDYAEIWVDGRLPLVPGGGTGTPRGWNAVSRVLVTADAHPGESHRIAVLAINGPLSDTPGNFVWIRSATLDVYRRGRADDAEPVDLRVDRLDPALDRILPAGARLERLASGFRFLEGPVWNPAGWLLFSDPNANVIYRWAPHEGVSIFRTKSGYAGVDIGLYGQPGSNGLTLDREGRLVVAEHGRRRIVRVEKNGVTTVLADRFEGKRLNSPNDLVYRSDGTLYFTDPPFGLPRFHDDPRRELAQAGIYRLHEGVLHLESAELSGPNGIAFSPDERFLYVSNWDVARKVILRFPVAADGALGRSKVFFDMTGAPGDEALDGLEVDELGNVYASGPGGLWIISPEGRHLGTLAGPELPANLAWGDADGRTLYLTARTGLYRLRLTVAGAGRTSGHEG